MKYWKQSHSALQMINPNPLGLTIIYCTMLVILAHRKLGISIRVRIIQPENVLFPKMNHCLVPDSRVLEMIDFVLRNKEYFDSIDLKLLQQKAL